MGSSAASVSQEFLEIGWRLFRALGLLWGLGGRDGFRASGFKVSGFRASGFKVQCLGVYGL